LESIALFSQKVAFNTAQRQLKTVVVEEFCSQLLASMEVPKHFAFTMVKDRNFHVCQHTSINNVGSSLFNFLMKSSKKGNAHKHSIFMAIGLHLIGLLG